jgi:septal ring factor EnvC (AmiA/AmiB activator)
MSAARPPPPPPPPLSALTRSLPLSLRRAVVEQQALQQSIASLRRQIAEIDALVSDFASQLGSIEQHLHDAVNDQRTLKNIDGIATKQVGSRASVPLPKRVGC